MQLLYMIGFVDMKENMIRDQSLAQRHLRYECNKVHVSEFGLY